MNGLPLKDNPKDIVQEFLVVYVPRDATPQEKNHGIGMAVYLVFKSL